MNIYATYREDFISAGLTCVTGFAFVPALTGYSMKPMCMWLVGFGVWLAMKQRSGK